MSTLTSAWSVMVIDRTEAIVLVRDIAGFFLPNGPEGESFSLWKRLKLRERRMPQLNARCSSLGLTCKRGRVNQQFLFIRAELKCAQYIR